MMRDIQWWFWGAAAAIVISEAVFIALVWVLR